MGKGNSREVQAVITLFGSLDPSLQRAIQDAQKSMHPLDKKLIKASNTLDAVGSKMVSTGKKLTKTVTAPIVAAGFLVAKTFTEYDDAIRQVQATIGATPEEMKKLGTAAKDAAIEAKRPAADAVLALNSIAQAGYNADQSISLLPKVMLAAKAGGIGLQDAASLVTESMAALGIEVKDLDGFIDQMARGGQASNTDIEGLGAGIKTVGADARKLKDGTVELITQLGILSNYGMKGEEAGTQFRNVLRSLTNQTETAEKQMARLGVAVYDSQGNLRGTNEIFRDMHAAMKNLTQEDKDAILGDIFNARDIKGATALINESVGVYGELSDQVRNSRGAAAQMAKDMESGLGGALRYAQSTAEGFLLELGERGAPYLRTAAEWVANLTRSLTKMKPETMDMIIKIAGIAAAVGPLLVAGGKLLVGAGKVLRFLPKLGKGIKLLGGALKLLGGPAGWAILAVGALVTLGVAIYRANKAAAERGLAERFGDIALSARDVETALATLDTPFARAVNAFTGEYDKLKQMHEELEGLDRDIRVTMFKVGAGVELSETDIEALKQQINDYATGIQNAISQEAFTVNMALTVLYGEDITSGKKLRTEVNTYYSGLETEAAAKGAELRKAFDEAIADGKIDEEERKTIEKLRAELTQIWAEGSLIKAQAGLARLSSRVRNGEFTLDSFTDLQTEMSAQAEAVIKEAQIAKDAADDAASQLAVVEGWSNAKLDATLAENNEAFAERVREQKATASKLYAEFIGSTNVFGGEIGAVRKVMAGGIDAFAKEAIATYEEEWGTAFDPKNFVMVDAVRERTKGLYENALDNALGDNPGAVMQEAKLFLEKTKKERDELTALAKGYADAGEEVPKDIADALRAFQGAELISGGDAWFSGITEAREVYNAAAANGTDYVSGLVNGLGNDAAAIEAANALGDSVNSASQSALGVNSPSWIAEESGFFYAQGLGNGLDGGINRVRASSQMLAQAVLGPTRQLIATLRGEIAASWNAAWSNLQLSLNSYLFSMQAMVQYVMSDIALRVSGVAEMLNGLGVTLSTLSTAASGGGIEGTPPIALADGMTAHRPTLAWIAEAGYAETAVPHNNKPRSRALALEALHGTGQSLGGGSEIVFAPVIHVNTNGSEDAVRQAVANALEEAEARFREWYERMRREEEREAYA